MITPVAKSWEDLVEVLRQRHDGSPAWKYVLELLATSNMSVESQVYKSDIVTKNFDGRFVASLIVHHAINQHRLDKKPFEYAFRDALRADSRKAELDPSETHPGADITIDGIPASLKTEGSKNIKPGKIVISKMMESAWMKSYKTLDEFHAGIARHIVTHLQKYDRMFMLRAFPLKSGQHYILVEIPMVILRAVSEVKSTTLTALTKAKGTSVPVLWKGRHAWTLKFDGSDDKITLTDLSIELCKIHAEWKVTWDAAHVGEQSAQGELPVQDDLS
jgi:type II restriction enzyme